MIEALRITNLGLIEEVDLELGPGFVAITGETGAGKTMLTSALGLVSGEKATASRVRVGAARALVEATVASPEGEVLLARSVTSTGRSRCLIDGATVPAPTMKERSAAILSMHGQASQWRLQSPAAQREVLDGLTGEAGRGALASVGNLFAQLNAIGREIAGFDEHAALRAAEAERLNAGLRRINQAEPESGEDERLDREFELLRSAEARAIAWSGASAALNGGDDAEIPGALALIDAAEAALHSVRRVDPAADAVVDRLQDLRRDLRDLAQQTATQAADPDLDPARLEEVAARRAVVQRLTREFGPTIDDVLAWAQAAADRLLVLGDDDAARSALAERSRELTVAYAAACAELTALRVTAAAALGDAVTNELQDLGLRGARLRVAVEPAARRGASGADEVTFEWMVNPGTPYAPIAAAASGGELSRLMLAIEVATRQHAEQHTIVFDEVDAGVSGTAALEVGRRLQRLGAATQVLVITHLPQVAAFADQHLVVAKDTVDGVTRTQVHEVTGEARAAEVARMLAGLGDSELALAHAAELLVRCRRSAD